MVCLRGRLFGTPFSVSSFFLTAVDGQLPLPLVPDTTLLGTFLLCPVGGQLPLPTAAAVQHSTDLCIFLLLTVGGPLPLVTNAFFCAFRRLTFQCVALLGAERFPRPLSWNGRQVLLPVGGNLPL